VIFTEAQQQAIDVRDSDVLVSAGAGSGKTAVLVERIMCMISGDNATRIDRLLVVTFTDAAAAEMRHRISAELNKQIKQNPNNSNLKKQLALMNKSNITTIHSFCLSIARRFFHKIDMDPGFRVGDTAEIELLRAEVLEDMFEYYYQSYYENGENSEFIRLVEIFNRRVSDENLRKLVLEVYEFSRSCPNPEGWLSDKTEDYKLLNGIEGSGWYADFKAEAAYILDNILDSLKEAHNLAGNPNINHKYQEVLANDINNAEKIISSINKSFFDFCGSLDFGFDSLPGGKSKVADDTMSEEEIKLLKTKIQGLRSEFKKWAEDMNNVFVKPPDEMEKDLKANADIISALCHIVSEFSDRYSEAKKEKNLADFTDFEHFVLKILFEQDSFELTPEAHMIQSEFDEIFIDEYQDLSIIQETILASVSGLGRSAQNRFMVGDIKQCIYQFRNARPGIFAEKYKRFADNPKTGKLIALSENFRSRKEVIETVNYLFSGIMSIKAGGVDYDLNSALRYAADYNDVSGHDLRTVLHIVDEHDEESDNTADDDALNELTSAEVEGKVVAGYINDLIKSGYQVQVKGGGKRPIIYSDIVILMRSTLAAQVFAEELKNSNIPAFSGSVEDYFLATEVMTALSILRIIDNPRQDIPLITVLYSAIFRFSPDELLEIRKSISGGDFYSALTAYGREGLNDALLQKVNDFLAKLEKWRDDAAEMTISELIFHIYSETDFYNYVGILPGGKVRRANLMLLFEKAAKYERTNYEGLFSFIKYIEKLQKNNFGFEQASVANENENLVRIMTIHKSKGLEFPVVFLCNLGKKFNLRDSAKDLVMDYDLGMGMRHVDLDSKVISDTFGRYVIGKKINREQISEEMRILYVSMTRAREKLYLVGTAKNLKKSCEKFDMPVRTYNVMKARSYLEWVLMALKGNIEGNSIWNIHTSGSTGYQEDENRKQKELGNILDGFKDYDAGIDYSGQREKIKHRLSYIYGNQNALRAPAKMSVSEVKRLYYRELLADSVHLEDRRQNNFRAPSFISGEGAYGGAAKGIAVHTVLEHADINKTDKKDLFELIDRLAEKKLLTADETKIIPIDSLLRFLNSDIADRMRVSGFLRREIPFATVIPSEIIEPDLEGIDGEMVLHGVVDCAFEEDGGLVIVDYKTERIKGSLAKMAEEYRPQMDLYQYALEKIFGQKVKERIIYFFEADTHIVL